MHDFLSGAGSVLSSILSGGLTGLFGIIVQRVADYKKQQLDLKVLELNNAHEVAMKEVDLKIMGAEWAGRVKIADVETAGRIDSNDAQAFIASMNEPKMYSEKVAPDRFQGWALVLLDFIRGIVRPGLTIYLCVLTTILYMNAKDLMAVYGGLDPRGASELLHKVSDTILYLATTTVLWWFGTRQKKKTPTQII